MPHNPVLRPCGNLPAVNTVRQALAVFRTQPTQVRRIAHRPARLVLDWFPVGWPTSSALQQESASRSAADHSGLPAWRSRARQPCARVSTARAGSPRRFLRWRARIQSAMSATCPQRVQVDTPITGFMRTREPAPNVPADHTGHHKYMLRNLRQCMLNSAAWSKSGKLIKMRRISSPLPERRAIERADAQSPARSPVPAAGGRSPARSGFPCPSPGSKNKNRALTKCSMCAIARDVEWTRQEQPHTANRKNAETRISANPPFSRSSRHENPYSQQRPRIHSAGRDGYAISVTPNCFAIGSELPLAEQYRAIDRMGRRYGQYGQEL